MTLLILILLAAGAGGPWDLGTLQKPPSITWLEREGRVRLLYYASENFHGKPTRVFAYYGVPAQVRGKVPAMVLVHGGGGKAFREWVEIWTQRGYAAIAMDLSGRGADGQRLPDGGPDQGAAEKFPAIADGVRECWPYYAVASVVRAVSVLAAQPEVDPRRIGITGISWGGYLTALIPGLDPRLKVAIPVYGCGFLEENSSFTNSLHQLPEDQRKLWIENFDPSQYLPRARLPMLWMNGTNDVHYRFDIYRKSYRLTPGPRTLSITIRMPHSHPAGWKPVEIGLFADQYLRGGVPLPSLGPMKLQDDHVEARFDSREPVMKSELCYTTGQATWHLREWKALPAVVAGNNVRAALPAARPIAFFLTLTDARGATVSTEYDELK